MSVPKDLRILCVLGIVASLASPSAASAAPATSVRRPVAMLRVGRARSLRTAVRTGALDRRVLVQLRRRGAANALLILDGSGTLAQAAAGAPSGLEQGRAFLRVARPAYASMKRRVLARLHGVSVLRDYRSLPIAFVRINGRLALTKALDDPEVTGVAANRRFRLDLAQSLPLIRQPQAAAAGDIGTGTAVAVLDTGVDYTKAAFGSCTSPGSPAACSVVVAQDFAPDDGSLDDNGHGTNVAGIVAGVAPGTKILALDVFSAGGSASASDVIAAIDFAITNQAMYGMRALNLSLGDNGHHTSPCSGGTNPYVSAFANARAAGIMPVVAAGNDGIVNGSYVDGLSNPACTPGALSVGAVYDSNVGGITWGPGTKYKCTDATSAADQIPCFSQSAGFLTVYAPGALITAAGITEGGTSQAAPHVSGAVAVVAAASPGLPLDTIASNIANSGPPISDLRNSTTKHRFDLPDSVAGVAGTGSDLSITKTDSPDPAAPGEQITYTITVTNNGPDPATAVNVTDALPASETLVSATGCTGTTSLSCSLGDIAPAAQSTLQVVVTASVAGKVSNTATVSATSTDPVSSNNSATATTSVNAACTITGTSRADFLKGTPGDDVICGLGGNDLLLGGGGNDVLIGGNGFDYADYETAPSKVTVDLGAGTATGGDGTDTLEGIEGVAGSAFADTLTGDSGHNEFLGLGGSDTIVGGAGFDFVSYPISGRGVRVNLATGTATGEGSDSISSVEGIVGSEHDDQLIGNARANVLYGLKGDDHLVGAGGSDRLDGGPGNDTLLGGSGNDRLLGGPGIDFCLQGAGKGRQSSC